MTIMLAPKRMLNPETDFDSKRKRDSSFISAREARENVEKTHDTLLMSFKQDIDKKIRQASGKSEECVEIRGVPGYIASELSDFLKQKGFRVDVDCPPSEGPGDNPPSKFRISW